MHFFLLEQGLNVFVTGLDLTPNHIYPKTTARDDRSFAVL